MNKEQAEAAVKYKCLNPDCPAEFYLYRSDVREATELEGPQTCPYCGSDYGVEEA